MSLNHIQVRREGHNQILDSGLLTLIDFSNIKIHFKCSKFEALCFGTTHLGKPNEKSKKDARHVFEFIPDKRLNI